MSPFKQERGRGRRKRTGSATASRTTSGAGSDDGCDGIRASTEPDEGGQSQRGSLSLVEEENDTRDRHEKASRGMVYVHNFLLYIALLDLHGTTMPFHALEVPSRGALAGARTCPHPK